MASDLKLTIAFTVLAVAFIWLPVLKETAIEAVLGFIMVLFLPGYAVIAALFPRKSTMDLIERSAMSFGVSIAVSSLFALLLNYTPMGIRLEPVILFLVALTLICVPVANMRRHALPPDDRFSVDFRGIFRELADEFVPASNGRKYKPVTFAIMACALLAICLLAAIVVMPHRGEKYTELYILGPDGKMDNYPMLFVEGGAKPVIVGIGNHEQRSVGYFLEVQLNDSGRISRVYNESVVVRDGQTWEKSVPINPEITGAKMKLEFLLYADDNLTAPYQETYLWVDVAESTS
jgi:uncharacterized membrane protein